MEKNPGMFSSKTLNILVDMGMSKLSGHVLFWKWTTPLRSECYSKRFQTTQKKQPKTSNTVLHDNCLGFHQLTSPSSLKSPCEFVDQHSWKNCPRAKSLIQVTPNSVATTFSWPVNLWHLTSTDTCIFFVLFLAFLKCLILFTFSSSSSTVYHWIEKHCCERFSRSLGNPL